MRSSLLNAMRHAASFAVLGVALLAGADEAHAADVYLKVEEGTKALPNLPDGATTVPIWGFSQCDDAAFTVNCQPVVSPGPQIDVDLATDSTLNIHVQNNLPTPTSIHIPGLGGNGAPTFDVDGRGRNRVRSFDGEVAAAVGGVPSTGMFTFDNLTPGTYLYQSGTHPSIQVPMGLVGAVTVKPATIPAGCTDAAYDDVDSCFDAQKVVLFSEIDPIFNNDVSSAAGNVAAYPLSIDYFGTYLLVNGDTSLDWTGAEAVGAGDITLLRFLNAGLDYHTPAFVNTDMAIIGEDGFRAPGLAHVQASVFMPPGKTHDVLVTAPGTDSTLSLMDRHGSSAYQAQGGNGSMVNLDVGLGSTPVALTAYAYNDDYSAFSISEGGTSFDTASMGAPSVLDNDLGLAGATVVVDQATSTNGAVVTMSPNGHFLYVPTADFAGVDTFHYHAQLGGQEYTATVTLVVDFTNDAPVAADDYFTNSVGTTIVGNVLDNDMDKDGDALTATLVTGPAAGSVTLNADGSFTYDPSNPNAPTSDSFTYTADDLAASSNVATVVIDVLPESGLVLNVHNEVGQAVDAYRFVVQQDLTFQHDPGANQSPLDTLTLNFHKSWMPVVADGKEAPGEASEIGHVALDPNLPHYVSILPLDAANEETGHTIGGARIPAGAAPGTVIDVTVNRQPIKTAQIAVQVFKDHAPTNGVPDATETGLGGFTILVEEPAGRYGQNGGIVFQGVDGSPLRNSLDCFGGNPPPVGIITSCPDGSVLIDNLAPGKYGLLVSPPANSGIEWVQTSTIEGSPVIDAWIQANEPPFFIEFGARGPHAFFGFVNPAETKVPDTVPLAERNNTITGQVTLLHDPRPPAIVGSVDSNSWDGMAHTRAWVGLNSVAGDGPNWASVPAADDGTFSMTGIPDGLYQLVIWDDFLDVIIHFQTVELIGGTGANVGHIPVNSWFTRIENHVFLDLNENGIREPDLGEGPLVEQAVNLRFRDGSFYQGWPTDLEGFVPFDEVFPFFNWMVNEVDFARFKATGVTVTVDGGGNVDGGPYPGVLSLQTGSPRTETGPVLTQGVLGFPGQTQIMEWGKLPYAPGENGGISGIVYYASTRGEEDPRLNAGDTWEGGLPGVTLRLYKQIQTDLIGGTGWALVNETTTDSFDDSIPTGCPGEADPADPFVVETLGVANIDRCYDGWRNWNQVRPAVFDGGYAFMEDADGNPLTPGVYRVEVVLPAGFDLEKEEDMNVGFGDVFANVEPPAVIPGGGWLANVPSNPQITATVTPEPGLAQPPCVGELRNVPDFMSLFPADMIPAPFANELRPLCDVKEIVLSDQGQSAADFHLFTNTPVAAQYTGLVLDDINTDDRKNSPLYQEKAPAANIPISLRDMHGHEVYKTYSDEYGKYNGLVPSTWTDNLPNPSGYGQAMYAVCLNDYGTGAVPDPYVNASYGNACYPLQFMPRVTTYLDTPVLPQAAFAAGNNPVDCAMPDGTPKVSEVVGGTVIRPGNLVIIKSMGDQEVPNPAFEGGGSPGIFGDKVITRDFGFGTSGTVMFGDNDMNALGLVQSWANDQIVVQVPNNFQTGEHQLVIIRDDNGARTKHSALLSVRWQAPLRVFAGQSIQYAIDNANPGDFIVVDPGEYAEMVIMHTPVRLKGSGAGSTIINAAHVARDAIVEWETRIDQLVADSAANGKTRLLPGQAAATVPFAGANLPNEEGAGITVLAEDDTIWQSRRAIIDGFTITGSSRGGGILVNGYADRIWISNNHVTGNSGAKHGGIRFGQPDLNPDITGGPLRYNDRVQVFNNAITLNGATSELSTGGGLSICTGTDNYTVRDNFICGNFTTGNGAGIGHYGFSDRGRIEGNEILFNQSVNGNLTRSGGGLFIGGEAVEPPFLSPGSGDLFVYANLIQGNQAASGHGGGIRLEEVNGEDVANSPNGIGNWNTMFIRNNMIVNNNAGYSGGGIAMRNAIRSFIQLNTIAHNDTTATLAALIDPNTLTSVAQPSGVVSEHNDPNLDAVIPANRASYTEYSRAFIQYNILMENRSFSYSNAGGAHLVPALNPATQGACPNNADYWDVGIIGGPVTRDPLVRWNLVTDNDLNDDLHNSNLQGDAQFLGDYCNGTRAWSTAGPMDVTLVIEEGGNSVGVKYGPLSTGDSDYHVDPESDAVDFPGASNGFPTDFDGQSRSAPLDVGADDVQ